MTTTTVWKPVSDCPAADLQKAEERLSSLPLLEDLFLEWDRNKGFGHTSETRFHTLLQLREHLLGPMTLPAATIELLYEVVTHSRSQCAEQYQQSLWCHRPLHARIIHHAPSLTAIEKQKLMPRGVIVQKTVSVLLGEACLLWTGVGSYHVTRRNLRHVGRILGLSSNEANHASINPTSIDPIERYGMQPGMVSSFLPQARRTGLAAVILLPPPPRQEEREPTVEIAISLSLWESLLLPLRSFPALVESYCRHACPTVPCISLESEF